MVNKEFLPWLHGVNRLQRMHGFSDNCMLDVLLHLLTGEAKQYWPQSMQNYTMWEAAQHTLQQHYTKYEADGDTWYRITVCHHRNGQAVGRFLGALIDELSRFHRKPDLPTMVAMIKDLLHSTIRNKLVLQDFGTMAELMIAAVKVESLLMTPHQMVTGR